MALPATILSAKRNYPHASVPHCAVAGPLSIGEGGASMQIQQSHKHDPKAFDYVVPIRTLRVHVGTLGICVTDDQLAAFLSLVAFKEEYSLWARYATRQGALRAFGRPRRGRAARAYWRCAKNAVLGAVRRTGISASNFYEVLRDAARYRTIYAGLLVEVTDTADTKEVASARQCLSVDRPREFDELLRLEDELPYAHAHPCMCMYRTRSLPRTCVHRPRTVLSCALSTASSVPSHRLLQPILITSSSAAVGVCRAETVAWCRLVTMQRQQGGKGRRRMSTATNERDATAIRDAATQQLPTSAPADGADSLGTLDVANILGTASEDALAEDLFEQRKHADLRIEEAPENYVYNCFAFHLDGLHVRLLKR